MEPMNVMVNVSTKQKMQSKLLQDISPLLDKLEHEFSDVEDDRLELEALKARSDESDTDSLEDRTEGHHEGEVDAKKSTAAYVEVDEDLYKDPDPTDVKIDWDKLSQMQELHEEVQQLREDSLEKDEAILELQSALVSLQEELEAVESQDVHGVAKEFAKKNRSLRVQITKDQSEINRLTNDLQSKESEIEELRSRVQLLAQSSGPTKISALKDQLQQAQDEIEKKTAKLATQKNQLTQLKMDMEKLRRILKKEIGAESEFALALQGKETWRGRAEEIARLKAKLEIARAKNRQQNPLDQSAETLAGAGNAFDVKHRSDIDRLQKERRKEHEALLRTHDTLKQQFDGLKRKYDASHARIKVLEKENLKTRDQLQLLVKKSTNDDQLVDRLQSANEELKTKLRQNHKQSELLEEAQRELVVQVETNQALQKAEKQYLNKIDHLERLLAEKKQRQVEVMSREINAWQKEDAQFRLQFLELENSKLHLTLKEVRRHRDKLEHEMKDLQSRMVKLEGQSLRPTSAEALNRKLLKLEAEHTQYLEQRDREVRLTEEMLEGLKMVHKESMNTLRGKIVELQQKFEH